MTTSKQQFQCGMGVRSVAVALMAIGLSAGIAEAAEVAEGTVISKDNLDKIRNDTFEGKTIGSMIPEKMELMIKNEGLTPMLFT